MSHFFFFTKSLKNKKNTTSNASQLPPADLNFDDAENPKSKIELNEKEHERSQNMPNTNNTDKFHASQRTKFYIYVGIFVNLISGITLAFISKQVFTYEFTIAFRTCSIAIPLLVLPITLIWSKWLYTLGGLLYLAESILFFAQGFVLLSQSQISQAKESYNANPAEFMKEHKCACWSRDNYDNCSISSTISTCEKVLQSQTIESFCELAIGIIIIMNSIYLFIIGSTLPLKRNKIPEDLNEQINSNPQQSLESTV